MKLRTKISIVLCALYGASCFGGGSQVDDNSVSVAGDTYDDGMMDDGMDDGMDDAMMDDAMMDDGMDDGMVKAGTAEHFAMTAGDKVYFDVNSFELDAEDEAVLQRQAQWLISYPSANVTISGYCDDRGTRDYNLALGARRASSVKDYLVSLGVDEYRIDTISHGKEKPVDEGHDETSWSLNRNVHTQVVMDDGMMDDN